MTPPAVIRPRLPVLGLFARLRPSPSASGKWPFRSGPSCLGIAEPASLCSLLSPSSSLISPPSFLRPIARFATRANSTARPPAYCRLFFFFFFLSSSCFAITSTVGCQLCLSACSVLTSPTTSSASSAHSHYSTSTALHPCLLRPNPSLFFLADTSITTSHHRYGSLLRQHPLGSTS